MDGTVNCAKREEGLPDFTGTADGSLLTGTATLAGAAATGLAATAAAFAATGALAAGFAATAGALAAGFEGAAGLATLLALDALALTVGVFLAAGAAALAAGAGVVFLAGLVTVFFGAGALALAGVLERALIGAAGFLAGATGTLAALAGLDLAAGTDLDAAPGLAFLVLVAFNSCLLIETQGARWRAVQEFSRLAGLPP